MIKIGVHGSSGRVGKQLVEFLRSYSSTKFCLSGAWSRSSKTGSLKELVANSDVIIDFSFAEALPQLIDECIAYKKPLISGTTGLDDEIIHKLQKSSDIIPVFYSANMSIGANLIGMMARDALSVLPEDFDVEIIDIHHKHKKDAPSGTALNIQKMMKDASGKHNINITSIRTGIGAGEHTVLFSGPDETVTVSHKTFSRTPYVKGACEAAIWICKQNPGMYNMRDFLLE